MPLVYVPWVGPFKSTLLSVTVIGSAMLAKLITLSVGMVIALPFPLMVMSFFTSNLSLNSIGAVRETFSPSATALVNSSAVATGTKLRGASLSY